MTRRTRTRANVAVDRYCAHAAGCSPCAAQSPRCAIGQRLALDASAACTDAGLNVAAEVASRREGRTPKAKRARRLTPEQAASLARIEAAHAEARAIVATGKCPTCGEVLKRNLSITGWWQCAQLGAVNFRKDPSRPSCDFQCFTE